MSLCFHYCCGVGSGYFGCTASVVVHMDFQHREKHRCYRCRQLAIAVIDYHNLADRYFVFVLFLADKTKEVSYGLVRVENITFERVW